MRMLSPTGNPQARNLFEVIGHLQRAEGLHFALSLKAASLRQLRKILLDHGPNDFEVYAEVVVNDLDQEISQKSSISVFVWRAINPQIGPNYKRPTLLSNRYTKTY
jgi:hypothetical protein